MKLGGHTSIFSFWWRTTSQFPLVKPPTRRFGMKIMLNWWITHCDPLWGVEHVALQRDAHRCGVHHGTWGYGLLSRTGFRSHPSMEHGAKEVMLLGCVGIMIPTTYPNHHSNIYICIYMYIITAYINNINNCRIWLVVWNMIFYMTFPSYWECHHPNCYSLHHFSEGLLDHCQLSRTGMCICSLEHPGGLRGGRLSGFLLGC